MSIKAITCIIVCIILFSCHKKHDAYFIPQSYYGYWAETRWQYTFYPDRTFKFKSEGHFGNVEDKGKYVIVDSLILLIPDTDWRVFHGVLKEKLKIIDSNCIRDFDNNFYCKSPEKVFDYATIEEQFQDSTIKILNELPQVKDFIQKYGSDTLSWVRQPQIRYKGITLINNFEYHAFSLEKMADFRFISYFDVLVTKQPFHIYEHHSAGDSISLIK